MLAPPSGSTKGKAMRDVRLRIAGLSLLTLAAALAAGCSRESRQHAADERLRAISEAEWRWRKQQLPGGEDSNHPLADHLPRGDPASQEERRKYWEATLRQ